MKYAKPPLSIDDQLALLRRRRMVFDDEAQARHALAHINYYRLRAYWLPFEHPSGAEDDHVFRPGTGFATVLEWDFQRLGVSSKCGELREAQQAIQRFTRARLQR